MNGVHARRDMMYASAVWCMGHGGGLDIYIYTHISIVDERFYMEILF